MPDNKELFSHAAIVLHVSDMDQSLHYYKDLLGFKLNFTWKKPVEYAVLKRGEINIHLSLGTKKEIKKSQRTSIYLFVYDVHKVYNELKNKGITIKDEIEELAYGMKEFSLNDPNGYLLTIGQGM